MAEGILEKIANLTDKKYADGWENLLDLDADDPFVTGAMQRVQASATNVERFFGRQDSFMRRFVSASAFTTHGYLIAHDEGMTEHLEALFAKDPELVTEMLNKAVTVGLAMRRRWGDRAVQDGVHKQARLEALHAQMEEHREKAEQAMTDLVLLKNSWQYSREGVEEEVARLRKRGRGGEAAVKEFLKTRCVVRVPGMSRTMVDGVVAEQVEDVSSCCASGP